MPETKAKREEREEAIARLSEWIKPGDQLYTILRHVSRSGMLRVIDVVAIGTDEYSAPNTRVFAYGWNVAKALGEPFDREREGVRVSGCGMDMGFHLVYSLSRTLFPDGFDCIGQNCPSNDHLNGDRDYTSHRHRDGGYALRQRWL